jgi:hypothetical protein
VPLVLMVDGATYRVFSSEFEAKLAARPRGGNNATGMQFSVSPELLLAMVYAEEVTGRVGAYTFAFPEEARRVLRDFASALRSKVGG